MSGMILMLTTSVLGAFPLTYKSLIGRKYINTYLLITMFFSGGLIPSFLLILKLGIYDTPLALIIPGCFSVWNIILTKSYLSTIPETLREAAKIDGASVYQILFRVYRGWGLEQLVQRPGVPAPYRLAALATLPAPYADSG
jgi:putative aldouronate transport system permease protein